MNAVLISPAPRPGVALLADAVPLVLAPLLGKSLLEYWLESLAAQGCTHVRILSSDRPHAVRDLVGSGARWGLIAEVVPEHHELTVGEVRAMARDTPGAPLAPGAVVLMDRLPGQPDLPLFESYASWFTALSAWMPHALTPARIGVTQRSPGIWVGLHAQVSSTARLEAPCWIGESALIGPDAVIGPNAIIEDCGIVERAAVVADSVVGPQTFVGEMISIRDSLASGSLLINWRSGSSLVVPDAFFLSGLDARRFAPPGSSWPARAAAFVAMVITAPFAVAVMALALLRGDSALQPRLGVRPQRQSRRPHSMETFAYYEITGARTWLRRWPQFWNVVGGDLAWFGNRPLRPTQVLALGNGFERLWLVAPVGLVSLADAHGCADTFTDETCAHASFYAVNASRRLNWFIFTRTLLQAAMSWPLRWTRRRERGLPIPQWAPKQEG